MELFVTSWAMRDMHFCRHKIKQYVNPSCDQLYKYAFIPEYGHQITLSTFHKPLVNTNIAVFNLKNIEILIFVVPHETSKLPNLYKNVYRNHIQKVVTA